MISRVSDKDIIIIREHETTAGRQRFIVYEFYKKLALVIMVNY